MFFSAIKIFFYIFSQYYCIFDQIKCNTGEHKRCFKNIWKNPTDFKLDASLTITNIVGAQQ